MFSHIFFPKNNSKYKEIFSLDLSNGYSALRGSELIDMSDQLQIKKREWIERSTETHPQPKRTDSALKKAMSQQENCTHNRQISYT